jgi:hypothetical protein
VRNAEQVHALQRHPDVELHHVGRFARARAEIVPHLTVTIQNRHTQSRSKKCSATRALYDQQTLRWLRNFLTHMSAALKEARSKRPSSSSASAISFSISASASAP